MDLNQFIRRIIKLVMQAQELASQIGISNILQPGLVKEMLIAETLGHKLIYSKRDSDAATLITQISNMNIFPATKAVQGNLTECSNHPKKQEKNRSTEF